MKAKQCPKCKETKALEEYNRHSYTASGFRSRCRECENAEHRAWYNADINLSRKYQRAYRQERNAYKPRKTPQLRNRIIRNIHSRVKNAVEAKKLTPGPCLVCNKKRVVAHHCDYAKPFDVMWLCHVHHKAWHRYFLPENIPNA